MISYLDLFLLYYIYNLKNLYSINKKDPKVISKRLKSKKKVSIIYIQKKSIFIIIQAYIYILSLPMHLKIILHGPYI